MNDRDKHLSLALDAMANANDLAKRDRFLYVYLSRSGVLAELRTAQRHIEEAAEMPKPSRIRSFVQRIREAA